MIVQCLLGVVCRNLHRAYFRMLAGNYTLSGLEGFEMRGKTVGVIGTGAIGSLVCRILLVSPYFQQLLVFIHRNANLNTAADLRMHNPGYESRQTDWHSSLQRLSCHVCTQCLHGVLFAGLHASACKSLSWSHG